jgi:hypothetical protein
MRMRRKKRKGMRWRMGGGGVEIVDNGVATPKLTRAENGLGKRGEVATQNRREEGKQIW